MIRALFFGTPEIAVPALEALHEIATIPLVVCQPDRPAGRGLAPKAPAIKTRALELGLRVEQPTKVKTPEFAELIRSQAADVALVMAYGRILPKAVLEAPSRGCINLHASILPRHRGAAPITWSIVEGDKTTGISLMQMDEGMDTGPVFAIRDVSIEPEMTAGELSPLLARCAAAMVRDMLGDVVAGKITSTPQDHSRATHARVLEKEAGRIDWSKSNARVHDHIRGMTPWPGAFTTVGAKQEGEPSKMLKLLSTRVCSVPADSPPGTVALAHRGRIEVSCGEGRLEIIVAQAEGRKPLGAAELVGGRTITQGMVLGRS